MVKRTEQFSRWQRAKYFVFIALLVMTALGAQWIGVLDPFSLLYRSVSLTVLPAMDIAMSAVANTVYLADPHLGPLHLRDLTEPVYRWWQDRVTATELRVFAGTTVGVFDLHRGAVAEPGAQPFLVPVPVPPGGHAGSVFLPPVAAPDQ